MRELRICVERLVIMVPGETITAADLGLPAPRAATPSTEPRLPEPSPRQGLLRPAQES